MRTALTIYEVHCDDCDEIIIACKGDPLVRHQLDAWNLFREHGWIIDGKSNHNDVCPECRKGSA